jgi:hypothetical protein
VRLAHAGGDGLPGFAAHAAGDVEVAGDAVDGPQRLDPVAD